MAAKKSLSKPKVCKSPKKKRILKNRGLPNLDDLFLYTITDDSFGDNEYDEVNTSFVSFLDTRGVNINEADDDLLHDLVWVEYLGESQCGIDGCHGCFHGWLLYIARL